MLKQDEVEREVAEEARVNLETQFKGQVVCYVNDDEESENDSVSTLGVDEVDNLVRNGLNAVRLTS